MNIALDIGKYSNDWWHNNLDQIYIADNELNFTTNTLTKEYNYSDIDITIVNELPVVVANDIAGALVGGTISIGVQYASSGSVNWTGVGYSAAASAIIASTGLIGKIGGWISRW